MNKERLGSFIGERRRELGLTQRELAERLHVTDKAVSKWERGLSYPDVTLLEPLAAALGLGVEELMACRRQAVYDGEEDPMKNLLTISSDSLRRERRRSWGRMGAVLALVLAAALVIGYNALYVTETRTQELLLKETVDGANYLYVKEGDHLLKLRCEGDVDFDGTVMEDEYGAGLVYALECRWNRLTYEGTVTACTDTGMQAIGSMMDQVGSSMGLDVNPETGDALFGYESASFEFRDIYPNPTGDGFLYSLLAGGRGDLERGAAADGEGLSGLYRGGLGRRRRHGAAGPHPLDGKTLHGLRLRGRGRHGDLAGHPGSGIGSGFADGR